jgi:hypothetical protein
MKALSISLCCIGVAALIVGIVLITLAMRPMAVAAVPTPQPAVAPALPAAAAPAPVPAATPVPTIPKNPNIMLVVETPRANHVWVNYWDQDGVERGAHIVCPSAQAANRQRGLTTLGDLLALLATHGTALGAWKDLGQAAGQSENPEAGSCRAAKRTWHYTYGGNGRLEMVEGGTNLGPVRMPN